MTKIDNIPNKEEAYKMGYRKGFGRALGLCISFMREYDIDSFFIKEMKEYVLKRRLKRKKKEKKNDMS